MDFEKAITISIVGVFYVCLLVVLFAPTLYTGWFYYISRKLSMKNKKKKLFQTFTVTFLLNIIVVYVLFSIMFKYILPSQIKAKDQIAKQTMESVQKSQEKFFSEHGRYYMVGPVRGPYKDSHGLKVAENVIVQAVPQFAQAGAQTQQTFEAYAIHVWGNSAYVREPDGTVKTINNNSSEVKNIRSKLIRSVK